MHAVIVLIFAVLIHRTADFQQTMNRLCRPSGRLGHTLRCTPGRCTKLDLHTFLGEIFDNNIDDRRFSGSGTTGNNCHPGFDRRFYSCPLQLIQCQFFFFFNLLNFSFQLVLFHIIAKLQIGKQSCRIQLHIIIRCQIDDIFFIDLLDHDLACDQQLHQLLFKQGNRLFVRRFRTCRVCVFCIAKC